MWELCNFNLMIAPDFRATENFEILKPAKAFIVYNYGKPPPLL